ncbi:MAG: amidase, partial [Actinomycetia bacterium]|nr:amidase [Actinomycetes bacterium]
MIDAPDTISGLAAEYRRGELSPVEVVDDHLARITRVGVRLNAFVAVDRERARTAAHQSLER